MIEPRPEDSVAAAPCSVAARLFRALQVAAFLAVLPAGLACVKAPPREEPDIDLQAPDAWQQHEEEPSPAALPPGLWWNTFDDERLPEIVETTLEANRDLKAAAARIDQAVAAARIASADLKPLLGIGITGAKQRQNFIGLPIPGSSGVLSTTYVRYGVSLDVAWEADIWGRVRARGRAALADLQAVSDEVEFARQSLAAQAAKAWFTVVEARQQVELAAGTAASRRDSLEQVSARYRRGLRPPLDLRLARSTLADAEALEALRRRQLNGAVRQLEILMGRYPSGTLLSIEDAAVLPPPPPAIPAGLPADLLQRRPDLRAAASRVTAADQRTLSARRALYPRLTLTASGGTVSEQLSDLVKGDFRVWSLLGGLTQPLFRGGRLRAEVRQADAVGVEFLELYAAAVLDAFAEVETTLTDEGWLKDQEVALAESADQLEAARRLALERYSSGVGDYLSVLESQTRELTARSALLAVRRQRLANRVDLYLALGGGFEAPAPDQDDPGAPENVTRMAAPSGAGEDS